MISAPASGQGKTVITLGLLRALHDAGVDVASGKSGPDYIDPAFHAAATGRPCVSLDAWAAEPAQLAARAGMQPCELLVVEGAMGLFDGAGRTGQGSAADLARHLGLPVIAVLDVSGMAQSAGAVAAGLSLWCARAGVVLGGVILNRVGSARHGNMVRSSVETVCSVLGEVPRNGTLVVPSRHLGLEQAAERDDLEKFVEATGAFIAGTCDIGALRALAGTVTAFRGRRRLRPLGQRIAVARDVAFGFAYWHMLEDWRDQGAEISVFSPLADEGPDEDADAVFLPGGYPELHAGRLAAAEGFRNAMHRAADRALIYGECGGYMVLGERLVDADGNAHRMLGLLRLTTSFAERRLHLGYRTLRGRHHPMGDLLHGHEFHYATTLEAEGPPLFAVEDATGASLGDTGLIAGRVMGSFAHVIEAGGGG